MFEILTSKGYKVYPESLLTNRDKIYFLISKNCRKYLVSNDFNFKSRIEKIASYNIYERTHNNALKLRRLFNYLNPRACGLQKSFGFGDRLGLATPGHIEALENPNIFPIFTQQSIRELNKTNRTIEEAIDDAMWGVFQVGYKNGYGADIDHVKNEKDILKAIDCGFTMFTIDSPDAKHITKLYNLIKEKISLPFDFEISIDEAPEPTTLSTHKFIVEKLRRNGVEFTGLALKFSGKFEKGIDYTGNIKTFKKNFLEHLAICKHYEGYKLSVHSGSDKFSIYPIIGQNADTFHVKTAGTSWLEAVRLISHKDPQLFRSMYQVALNNFEESCKAYQITTTKTEIPDINKFSDKDLSILLNINASRQLIHISYGVLLKDMKNEIYNILNLFEKEHYQMLKNHLGKHLKALS